MEHINELLRMERNKRSIAKAQKREMLWIGYYLWYAIEFYARIVHFFLHPSYEVDGIQYCYEHVSLKVEQERKKKFSSWPRDRKPYFWKRYIFNGENTKKN